MFSKLFAVLLMLLLFLPDLIHSCALWLGETGQCVLVLLQSVMPSGF